MSLTPAEAALVEVSAALSGRSPSSIHAALRSARDVADPVAVEEALLQSYLFLGYPAALNGLAAWREISGLAAPEALEARPSLAAWSERGAGVCRTVYGGQYERLKANVRRLQPEMERWMIVEGYGKVLARPGLALELRELCIVALLTVQDVPRQLYSHLRGALNAGSTPERVEAALAIAGGFAPETAAERAGTVWREVRDRSSP